MAHPVVGRTIPSRSPWRLGPPMIPFLLHTLLAQAAPLPAERLVPGSEAGAGAFDGRPRAHAYVETMGWGSAVGPRSMTIAGAGSPAYAAAPSARPPAAWRHMRRWRRQLAVGEAKLAAVERGKASVSKALCKDGSSAQKGTLSKARGSARRLVRKAGAVERLAFRTGRRSAGLASALLATGERGRAEEYGQARLLAERAGTLQRTAAANWDSLTGQIADLRQVERVGQCPK